MLSIVSTTGGRHPPLQELCIPLLHRLVFSKHYHMGKVVAEFIEGRFITVLVEETNVSHSGGGWSQLMTHLAPHILVAVHTLVITLLDQHLKLILSLLK